MKFSTAFPFVPHISTRKIESEEWDPPQLPLMPLTVSSIFVDYGNKREVFKLQ